LPLRRQCFLNVGVGEPARIIVECVKTCVFHQRTKEFNYVAWQKMVNQGIREETLTLPSFTAPRAPSFSTPGGISVQIPAGEFRSQMATLSAQPGMAYLNELTARTDVNWQPVNLAHDKWDYKRESLTPAGAALLSVAVVWATGGIGANLLGTTGGATSAMAKAAFTSLAAEAASSSIYNKGDVGNTLKELGSNQTVKAAIAAVLTAGVQDKLDTLNGMG
jgi:filamentous hemagglutinin